MMEVAHLSLHKLVEEFCLSAHDLGQIWRWRWRLLGTAGLIWPKTIINHILTPNFQMIYSCQIEM
jgi:hypothetical protein